MTDSSTTWVRIERLDDTTALTATVEVADDGETIEVPREELENLLALAGFRPVTSD